MKKNIYRNIQLSIVAIIIFIVVLGNTKTGQLNKVANSKYLTSNTNDCIDENNNNFNEKSGVFIDYRDKNQYKRITIGTQIWLGENVSYDTDYGSWCYQDKSINCGIYGKLYNWEMAQKVCPSGWHLPNEEEFTILINYLGGKNVAGGKLKSTGNLWKSPNSGATNSSGFSALPGGSRMTDGLYLGPNRTASFWCSTSISSRSATSYNIYSGSGCISRSMDSPKGQGKSVRCIKN